jgi:hypothetical protein
MSERVSLRAKRKRSGSVSALDRRWSSAVGQAAIAAVEPLERRMMMSATATFVRADATTQGNWGAVYGQDGYDVFQGNSSLPAYANVLASNANGATWLPSTSAAQALEQAPWYDSAWDSSRIEACYYGPAGVGSSFSLDVNLTDGQTHEVAIYLLDGDSGGRAETVQVSDTQTGSVLDTQSVSTFTGGQYLVWNLSGDATITLTCTAGYNAVASGLFFAPPAVSPDGPAAATFVDSDTNTAGNWQGVYGSDGYNLLAASSSMPSYAGLTAQGAGQAVWSSATTDPRALQDPSTGSRVASCDYSGTSFGLSLNLNLGAGPHQVALYLLDYDLQNRAQTVTVEDAYSGTVLDTRSVSNFTSGMYLIYELSGDVRFTIGRDQGTNAVVSGVFFDPVTTSTVPRGLLVTGTTPTGVSLQWYSVPGATSYNVYRDGTPVGSSTTASYTDAGGVGDTDYNYQVTAVTPAGESGLSDPVKAHTLSDTNSGTDLLWSDTAPPNAPLYEGDIPDSGGLELGVAFTTDVSGTVTGVQFWKTLTNTGPHVGQLWDASTGALLAQATFTGESEAGWQQVDFSSPVSLLAGHSYVASYYETSGRYAAADSYFTSSGTDAVPLHAAAGNNGLYSFGSPSCPTSVYDSTNYWVQPVFTASGSAITPTVPLPAVTAGDADGNDLTYTLAAGFTLNGSGTFTPLNLVDQNVTSTGTNGSASTMTDVGGYTNNVSTTTTPTLQVVETVDGSGNWSYVETAEETVNTTQSPQGVFGTWERDTVSYGYTFTASGDSSGHSSYTFISTEAVSRSGSASWAVSGGTETQTWSESDDHWASIDSNGTNDQTGHDWRSTSDTAPFSSITMGFTFGGTLSESSTASDAYAFTNSSGTTTQINAVTSGYLGTGPFVDVTPQGTVTGSATDQGSDNSVSTVVLVETRNGPQDGWTVNAWSGSASETITDSNSYNGSSPAQATDTNGVTYTGMISILGDSNSTKAYQWTLGLGSNGTLITTGGTGVISDGAQQSGLYNETGNYIDVTGTGSVPITQTDSGSNSSDSTFAINETWNPGTGQWVATSGGGTSGQTVLAHTDYNGNGPAEWTDSSGFTYTGTASESGSNTNLSSYSSQLQLDPSSGQLQTASGTGLSTDDSTASSYYSASGTYVDDGNATISGTQQASGSDSSNSDSTIVENWDVGQQTWVAASASGTANETVINSSSYGGNGPYNLTDTLSNHYSGTANESGSDQNTAVYQSDYGLENGQIAVVGGSGTITDVGTDGYTQTFGASSWVDGNGHQFSGNYSDTLTDNSNTNSTLNDTWSNGEWVAASASGTSGETINDDSNYHGTAPDSATQAATGTLNNVFSGTVSASGTDSNQSTYSSDLGLGSNGQVAVVGGTGTITDLKSTHSGYSDGATSWYDASGNSLSGTASNSGSDDASSNSTLNDAWDSNGQAWVDQSGSGSSTESATNGSTYNGTGRLGYVDATSGASYSGSLTETGSDTTVSTYSTDYGLGATGGLVNTDGTATITDTRQSTIHSSVSATYTHTTSLSSIPDAEWVSQSDVKSGGYTLHQNLDTAHGVWANTDVSGTAGEQVANTNGYTGTGSTNFTDTATNTYVGDASESGSDTQNASYASSPQLDAQQSVYWTGTGTSVESTTNRYDYSGDDDELYLDPSIAGSSESSGTSTLHYSIIGGTWVANDGTGTNAQTLINQFNDDDDVEPTYWADASNNSFSGTYTVNDDNTISTDSTTTQVFANGVWTLTGGSQTQTNDYSSEGILSGTDRSYTFTDTAGTTYSGSLTSSVDISSSGHSSIAQTYNPAGQAWVASSGGGNANQTTISSAGFSGTAPTTWTDDSGNDFTGSLSDSGSDTQQTVYASNLTLGPDGQLHPDNAATQSVSDDQIASGSQRGSASYTFADTQGDTLTGSLTESSGIGTEQSVSTALKWDGVSTWTTTGYSGTSTQTDTVGVDYTGTGPSTWQDAEGDQLNGTATQSGGDTQGSTYSYQLSPNGSKTSPAGTSSDVNSASFSYTGTGTIDGDVPGASIGSVVENGGSSIRGNSTITLSFDGAAWQPQGVGSGSTTESDTATRTFSQSDSSGGWVDLNGDWVDGTTTESGKKTENDGYTWDLTMVNGTLAATGGSATLTSHSDDTVSEHGTGTWVDHLSVSGTVTDSQQSTSATDSTATETYASGAWQAAGGTGQTSQSASESSSYHAEQPYSGLDGAAGNQTYDGSVAMSSDVSTDVTLNTSTGAWDLSDAQGSKAYSGEDHHTYAGTATSDYDSALDMPGSTSLSLAGSDDLSYSFQASASVAGGSLAWSGTGEADHSTTNSADYEWDDGYEDDNESGPFSQETATSTGSEATDSAAEVKTHYTLSPQGTWAADYSDSTDEGTATGDTTGTYSSTEPDEYGTWTSASSGYQSFAENYTHSLHVDYGPSGDRTITGSGSGQGDYQSNSSDSNADPYQNTFEGSNSATYHESWSTDFGSGSPADHIAWTATSTQNEYDNGQPDDVDSFTSTSSGTSFGGWSGGFPGPLTTVVEDLGYGQEPSTDPVGTAPAAAAAPPALATVQALNLGGNPPAPIIQPQILQEVQTKNPPSAPPGAQPANGSGYTWPSSEIQASWSDNFFHSLFYPSDFAGSPVATPKSIKYTQIALNIVGGAALGGAAGVVFAGYLGTAAAGTWAGTFLTNAVGGSTGSFFQNAATQLGGDQPFSYTQLITQTAVGGVTGGATGVAFKAVGGAISSFLGKIPGEVTGATSDDVVKTMGGSVRNTLPLTAEQEQAVRQAWAELGQDPAELTFFKGNGSGYNPGYDKVGIAPDIWPATAPDVIEGVNSAQAALTLKAALAHEAGHMISTRAGFAFAAQTVEDEVLASLVGRTLPTLTSAERQQLLEDALERAVWWGHRGL